MLFRFGELDPRAHGAVLNAPVQQPLSVPARLHTANNAPLPQECLPEFYKVAWDHWMEEAVQV